MRYCQRTMRTSSRALAVCALAGSLFSAGAAAFGQSAVGTWDGHCLTGMGEAVRQGRDIGITSWVHFEYRPTTVCFDDDHGRGPLRSVWIRHMDLGSETQLFETAISAQELRSGPLRYALTRASLSDERRGGLTYDFSKTACGLEENEEHWHDCRLNEGISRLLEIVRGKDADGTECPAPGLVCLHLSRGEPVAVSLKNPGGKELQRYGEWPYYAFDELKEIGILLFRGYYRDKSLEGPGLEFSGYARSGPYLADWITKLEGNRAAKQEALRGRVLDAKIWRSE